MSDEIEMPHPKAEVFAVVGVDEDLYGAELEAEMNERLEDAFDSVERIDVYTL